MPPYCTTHDIYELWNATIRTTYDIYELWNDTISDDVHVASSSTTGTTSGTGTVNHFGPHEFLVFSGIRVTPFLIFLCSIV